MMKPTKACDLYCPYFRDKCLANRCMFWLWNATHTEGDCLIRLSKQR